MEVGKPKRIYRVEPLHNPVPAESDHQQPPCPEPRQQDNPTAVRER